MGRRLAKYVTTPDESGRMVTLAPGDEVSDDVAKGITRDDVWEDAEAESYKDMKVDALKAEIARRNEDRDEDAQLPSDGKKAELVAVLEADDASKAE